MAKVLGLGPGHLQHITRSERGRAEAAGSASPSAISTRSVTAKSNAKESQAGKKLRITEKCVSPKVVNFG
jgi:hypothetical protein